MRYADDTVIIASSLSDLQHLIDTIVEYTGTKLTGFSKMKTQAFLRTIGGTLLKIVMFQISGGVTE